MLLEPLWILWLKFWHVLHLAIAISTVHPEIPPSRILPAAALIMRVAQGEDEALISELACGESTLKPWKINKHSGACGPMQTLFSKNPIVQVRRCKPVLADALIGYRAGVQKLKDARAHCLRHRKPEVLCEIAGFRSGPAGVKGEWYAKPREILARRDQIRAALRALEPAPTPVLPEAGT